MVNEFAIELGGVYYLIHESTYGQDYGTRLSWKIAPIFVNGKSPAKMYNEDLSNAVELLNKGESYAGMSPREFILKMTNAKSIRWNGEL